MGLWWKITFLFPLQLNKRFMFPHLPPGGHWPRKGVWGCAALKTPFSRLSCRSQGSHFKQKSQFTTRGSQDPLLRKFGNFSLYSLNFHPSFSSQAPKFGNFQLTSPPFHRQMSVRKPHTSEIRAAHPYLKKSWVPPPPRNLPMSCLQIFSVLPFKSCSEITNLV